MNGYQSATASLSIESTRWPCLFRILWINHSARTTVVQKVNNNVRVSTFCCAHRVRYGVRSRCMLVAVTNPGTWPWMMLPVSGNVRSIGPVLEMMYEPSSSTEYCVIIKHTRMLISFYSGYTILSIAINSSGSTSTSTSHRHLRSTDRSTYIPAEYIPTECKHTYNGSAPKITQPEHHDASC